MNLSFPKPEVILLFCSVFFGLGWSRVEGCEWKLYHLSHAAFYFFDLGSVTQSATALKVSEKSVLRQTKPCNLAEAVKEISELEKKNSRGMPDEARRKAIAARAVQETRRLYEIQCQAKMARVITGMEYDKEETLIDAVPSSKWETIKPNSIIEKLYEAVCR